MLCTLLSLPLDLDNAGIALEGGWDFELLAFVLSFGSAAREGAVFVSGAIGRLYDLQSSLSGCVSNSDSTVSCWRRVHDLPGEHVSGAWSGLEVHSAREGSTTWLKWQAGLVHIFSGDGGQELHFLQLDR